MKKLSLLLALAILCMAFASCNIEKQDESSEAVESSKTAESSEEVESSETAESNEDEAPTVEIADPIALSGEVISLGCQYEVPGGKGYVVNDDKWPANYTANLTDGVFVEQLVYNSSWFSFNTEPDADGEANTINNVGTAIIDLGEVKNITGARANICTGDAGASIAAIGSVVIWVSEDGVTYSNPFKLNLPTGVVGWAEGGCVSVSGRYVKVEFHKGGDGFHMFTNEIEIYGN